MLQYRLKYLYPVVDYFVIVEATNTHSGNPKSLHFNENKQLFSDFLDKIVHVVVDDMPLNIQPSRLKFRRHQVQTDFNIVREMHQRICIDRGISRLNLQPDDLILISDVDEIPDIRIFNTNISDGVNGLLQDFYYYNVTCKNTELWTQSRILNYKTYVDIRDPQAIRTIQPTNMIADGGWHLSYFGDAKFIANKLQQFCHSKEYGGADYTNEATIADKIANNQDLLGRSNETWIHVPIDTNTRLPPNYTSFLTIKCQT